MAHAKIHTVMPDGFYSPFDEFFESFGPSSMSGRYPRSRERRIDLAQYLSERGKEIINEAGQEAAQQGTKTLDTEHLLLAVAKDKELGAKILEQLGIEPKDLINHLGENIKKASAEAPEAVSLSPRAKRVLQLAFYESQELGHSYIGAEHILLALIREGEGLAAQTLKKYAIDLTKARAAVIKLTGKGAPEGKAKDVSKTPELDQYSRDLTKMARAGKLDPVIGREEEIERVIHILSRRTKNNPVLIGDPGVGKTAIVEGLAQRIASNEIPDTLQNKRVLALDLPLMLAGTKFRGQFEERLKKVVEEIEEASREIILFIDELHTVVGAGASEGAIDASNILKPPLSRGELQAIGATTLNEYKKYIEPDAALERRFQPIVVKENTIEETIQILKGLRDRYEAHHRVKITDQALEAAATLSDRYMADRFLPDKAIDLIDEAAAKVRLRSVEAPENLKQAEEQLKKLRSEKEAAERAKNKDRADELEKKIDELEKVKEELTELWQRTKGTEQPEVLVDDVAEVVSRITGIPLTQLSEDEREKLLHLENRLHKRIVNQNSAVEAVSEAIRRARAGLKDPNRPIGTFLFLGPTGVGKTELTRALAEVLYGDENLMVRLDMSEFQERHAIARLIGSPPGYVGHEEGGQLTEVVRRKPFSVILLDEIEKAHPDAFNLLLQIMEDGRLTDGKGRTVDFKNSIIIMTSNLGSDVFFADLEEEEKHNRIDSILRRTFRPEFLNRLDEIILFRNLNKEDLLNIVELQLKDVQNLLDEHNMKLEVTKEAKEYLVDEGYEPEFGARPIRRLIQREIENPISDKIIKGELNEGDTVKVLLEDNRLTVKK